LLNSLREAISAIGNRPRSQQSCAFHAAGAQILALAAEEAPKCAAEVHRMHAGGRYV